MDRLEARTYFFTHGPYKPKSWHPQYFWVLIEISEVKLAMGSIRGQIWTDWRPEPTFLPMDPTNLKADIQGTFGC